MTYTRNEYGSGSDSGFMMGLLAGAAVGAGVALLFAPREGSQMRHELASGAQRLGQKLSDGYGSVAGTVRDSAHRVMDQASDVVDRGREAYRDAADDVRHGAERTADKAQDYASHATGSRSSSTTGGINDPFNRPIG